PQPRFDRPAFGRGALEPGWSADLQGLQDVGVQVGESARAGAVGAAGIDLGWLYGSGGGGGEHAAVGTLSHHGINGLLHVARRQDWAQLVVGEAVGAVVEEAALAYLAEDGRGVSRPGWRLVVGGRLGGLAAAVEQRFADVARGATRGRH